MAKAAIGHGRVTKVGESGVAGLNDRLLPDELPDPRSIAESICAMAYVDGKTDGVYAIPLAELARRTQVSRQTQTAALAAGIGCGWLRQAGNRIQLTAAGIYIAKAALKLPT